MPKLQVFREGRKLAVIDIVSSELVIGRDPTAGLRIDDPLASRRHARLVAINGRFHIEDMGASNGLFVNGVREYNKPLSSGDRVEIGKHMLVYEQSPGEMIYADDELDTADRIPAIDPEQEGGMQTQHISPADMAKLRRQVQTQMEPHLIQEGIRPPRIHPLKHSRNAIGTGGDCELRIPEVGKKEAAVFERQADGSFVAKKAGLFGSLKVNGQKTSEIELSDGDKLEIGGANFTYRAGQKEP